VLRQKNIRLKRFVLGKTVKAARHGQAKWDYKRNLEKALIISLLAAIFGIRLAASFDINSITINDKSVTFESIDIPLINPIVEEPPALKMEEFVTVEKEEIEVYEEDSNLEEIEKLLEEDNEEVELALNTNDLSAYLLSSSPLGNVSGPEIKLRKNFSHGKGKISLKKSSSYETLMAESELNIDIGKTKRNQRGLPSDDVKIEIKSKTERKFDRRVNNSEDFSLGLSGVPARILSFSSSTIGTEDYKLWNKLNSELDRLNKGRYGSVPKEIKRNKRGFIVSLNYPDGVQHEIRWQADGNVWIKVIGQSKKTSLEELRRALNGLIKLTLSN
jgi:hypothetical protein